ncbi:hypothetical protein V1522DRAFT_424773 [Lipomyces starkeyi]
MAVADTEGGSQGRNINRELDYGDDDGSQFAGNDDDVGMDYEDQEDQSDVESDFSDDFDELSGDDEMDILDVDIEKEDASVNGMFI